ncbi:hypothetical protein LA983_000436 [Vibrio fluvialis]|nr:hypothetical protein [Vibrio fluvialis]
MMVSNIVLYRLKWLLIATFFSSILHYVDNIVFFADYPEPVWINPRQIDLFWIAMTPLAPIGYQQIKQGRWLIGAGLLVMYGVCNMLTLGHYNYAPFTTIAFKIHAFILIEALLGSILIGYASALCLAQLKRCA